MADSTIFPVGLRYFQLKSKANKNPRLASPISATATSLTSTAPALDATGAVIPGDFIAGCTNSTGGYTEGIYVPRGTLSYDAQSANFTVGELITGGTSGATARVKSDTDAGTTGTLTLYNVVGAFQDNEALTGSVTGVATVDGTLVDSVSADGKTWNNLERGIDLEGLDYTVGDANNAEAMGEGSTLFCSVHPVVHEMVINAIQGGLLTGGNSFRIGRDQNENIRIYFENGDTNSPYIGFDAAGNVAVLSNDGVSEVNLASGGVQSAGDGVDLTGGVISVDLAAANPGLEFSGGKLRLLPAVIQANSFTHATDTGAADAYVIAPSPAITTYAAGQMFSFVSTNTNTGASTLNVNALGVKSIVLPNGDALSSGNIVSGQLVQCKYDGTDFQLVSPIANSPSSDPSNSFQAFSSLSLDGWSESDVGSGSKTINEGVVTLGTGTTTNNYESFYRAIQGQSNTATGSIGTRFGDLTTGQKLIFEFSYRDSTASPTNTELRMGFGDALTGTNTDSGHCAKFRIIDGQPSIYSAGASSTTQNFAITTLNVFHTMRIEYTVGTSVVFSVDGAVVHTETTNIPTTTSNATQIHFYLAVKTTTTSAKSALFGQDVSILLSK